VVLNTSIIILETLGLLLSLVIGIFFPPSLTCTISLPNDSTDEVNKAGAYLRDYMTDPAECQSVDVAHTPFQMAFKPEGNLFTWYGEPSNAVRLARFNAAMKGSLNVSPMNILKGNLFVVFRFVIMVIIC